jgi:hypothetical protein
MVVQETASRARLHVDHDQRGLRAVASHAGAFVGDVEGAVLQVDDEVVRLRCRKQDFGRQEIDAFQAIGPGVPPDDLRPDLVPHAEVKHPDHTILVASQAQDAVQILLGSRSRRVPGLVGKRLQRAGGSHFADADLGRCPRMDAHDHAAGGSEGDVARRHGEPRHYLRLD